jgi:hypothetical protein
MDRSENERGRERPRYTHVYVRRVYFFVSSISSLPGMYGSSLHTLSFVTRSSRAFQYKHEVTFSFLIHN